MAIITQSAKIGFGGAGGSKAWKISFNAETSEVTVGYGTMIYNGKFLTTNDILTNPIATGIGTDNKFTLGLGGYVYIHIYNPLSLPQETSDSLKIKIDIESNFTEPNTLNTNAPLIEYIPLAYVQTNSDGTVTVFDLRAAFDFNNFAFLA